MHLNKNNLSKIEAYLSHFDSDLYETKVLKNIEKYNDVILIKSI
jgi:hypothetical protein